MHPSRLQEVREAFCSVFGRAAEVVARAPGRVNLIGEHTDYNEGLVLPMALEQSTWVAAAPRDNDRLRVRSLNLDSEQEWPIAAWRAESCAAWTCYVAGVAALLRRRGANVTGGDLLVRSDVPTGGGLSSSAALEVSTALALAALAGARLAPVELADLCRSAEHEFAKVPCGIMDQYVSVLAQESCAFLLDCRNRTWEHIPLQLGNHVIVVVDSGVKHALAASAYATRQAECARALAYFQKLDPRCRALRDVSRSDLEAARGKLDPPSAARAAHVTSENERTLSAAAALRVGDLAKLGRLMDASHRSLRDDYEVSCPELDLLVEIVGDVPGVRGARMTGGGFGGCIVAVAHEDSVPSIVAALRARYDQPGRRHACVLLSRPGAGATLEFPPPARG